MTDQPLVQTIAEEQRTGRWSLDELDAMHAAAGLGAEWLASTRRHELAKTIGRAADRLEALAYEAHRRCAIDRAKTLLAKVNGLGPRKPPTASSLYDAVAATDQLAPVKKPARRITATEYFGAMVGRA